MDIPRYSISLFFAFKLRVEYSVHKMLFRHHIISYITNTYTGSKNLYNPKYEHRTQHSGETRNVDVSRQQDGSTDGRSDGKTGMAPPVRNSPTSLHSTPLPPQPHSTSSKFNPKPSIRLGVHSITQNWSVNGDDVVVPS